MGWVAPGRVGGAARELVLARRRGPVEGPAVPGGRRRRRLELGVGPRRAAVDADLDPLDRARARPRPSLERRRARRASTRSRSGKLGMPGGTIKRPHPHATAAARRARRRSCACGRPPLAGSPRTARDARRCAPSHFTCVMPYQPGTTQSQRRAVLGKQRLPVHLVHEQHVVAHRLVERQAPLVRACSSPPSTPRSRPVNTISTVPSGTPASCSRGASGVPVHSAVPTASSSHGWLSGRVSNIARPLPAHSSVTGIVTAGRARSSSRREARSAGRSRRASSGPRGRVDERHVVVDQHVVHAGRRDVGPHRLERHAVVAGGLARARRARCRRRVGARMARCNHVSRAECDDLGPSVTAVTEASGARVRSVDAMSIKERLETLSRGELIGLVVVVAVTMAGRGSLVRAVPAEAGLDRGRRSAGRAAPCRRAPCRPRRPSPSGAPIIVDVTGWVHEPGVYEFVAGRPGDRRGRARRGRPQRRRSHRAEPGGAAHRRHPGHRAEAGRGGPAARAPGDDRRAARRATASININTASATEFETLSGIGEVLAGGHRRLPHRERAVRLGRRPRERERHRPGDPGGDPRPGHGMTAWLLPAATAAWWPGLLLGFGPGRVAGPPGPRRCWGSPSLVVGGDRRARDPPRTTRSATPAWCRAIATPGARRGAGRRARRARPARRPSP